MCNIANSSQFNLETNYATLTMPPPSYFELFTGLQILRDQFHERRQHLESILAEKKQISPDDAEWLDGAANLTDEALLLDKLSNTSDDYEKAFKDLSLAEKTVAEKLRKFNQAVNKVATKNVAVTGAKQKGVSYATLSSKNTELYQLGSISASEKTAGVKKSKPSIKKENATVAQRIEILDWHNLHGKNQSKTAKHFSPIYPNLGIKQPLESEWVQEEDKWRKQFATSGGQSKKDSIAKFPHVHAALQLWVTKSLADNVTLNGEIIRQKWRSFAKLAGVPKGDWLALSEGWLTSFKASMGLKNFKRHGEAASADPNAVAEERERVSKILAEYDPDDQWNGDETGLFWA